MGLSRDIAKLRHDFRQLIEELIKKLDQLVSNGSLAPYRVFETVRTKEVQEAYYAQGRKGLEEVNRLRTIAGLWKISEKENKDTVTQTLKSKHIEGIAIDIVGWKNNNFSWNMPDDFWKTIAHEAVKMGLSAGYYWQWQDKPHIEL